MTKVRAAVAVSASLIAALLVAGCTAPSSSTGEFTPNKPDTLVVAASPLPEPGYWVGTDARHITGGFEYELATAIAKELGLSKVKPIAVPFDDILNANFHGADIAMAEITDTAERREKLDFTPGYLDAPPGMLTLRQKTDDFPDLHAAREAKWSVTANTTLVEELESVVDPNIPPLQRETERETVEDLYLAKSQAVLLDLPTALAYANASGGTLGVAGQFPGDQVLAAALPAGSPNTQAVSSAMRKLLSDGTVRALAKKWLGVDESDSGIQDVPLIQAQRKEG